ncbi:vgr related protein [Sphingomonas sp. Leaf62]|uniref:vgr related protein n=1 Tax=Sphingomonas sp. Leaf62 TaxID=1736228 RepID=UPI0012E2F554|nr:vgr related protein [Sphingomonas sp. Leaf62]
MMRRPLTASEIELARTMFGEEIAYDRARVANAKWAFFQPKQVAMAPTGCIHFHPGGTLYRDDFASAGRDLAALFLHEMMHIHQTQHRGRYWLPLMRHPLCSYRYAIVPGKPFAAYGIEQQAEIVRQAFLLRQGVAVEGKPPLAVYEALLPFGRR